MMLAQSGSRLVQRGLLPQPRTVRCFRTSFIVCGRRSAKIATKKNKMDAVRGKILSRFGKRIIQLVKVGGPDPTSNSKLADMIRQAKDAGVPKDNIERNLKKGSEAKQANFTEVVYEAYGPGGCGFIVEALTDNVNRSASDVKAAIVKGGGKPADVGSVLFSFKRQGCIFVDNTSEEAIFESAMEAGANDIVPAEADEEGVPSTSYKVFTEVEDFAAVLSSLKEAGLTINEDLSSLVYQGTAEVEVDDEAFATCEAMMERLLELDDVDAVYTNVAGLSN